MSELLQQLDYLPEPLLSCQATELHQYLDSPTLVHLQGRRADPLFVSVLLHGNEDTGLLAIQALLNKYSGKELPRSLSIFFGNVDAARDGLRRLDGQHDYNRVWPGCEGDCNSPEHAMTRAVVEEMRRRSVFASVDIHNNTGLNPHYACVNKLDHRFLHLATMFSRTVVYFIRPRGVQSMAFAELCPATTLECGKPHQPNGVEHAMNFVDGCLHMTDLPDHPVPEQDIDLFHTVAQVTLSEDTSFSFDHEEVDIRFNPDIDHMNFRELPRGTEWGTILKDGACPVARDEQGNIVTSDYFDINNQRLVIRKPVMPSMLTLDERVIRQDCLGYLMERLAPPV